MYAGTVFLGGKHGELGADAVFEEVTAEERELLGAALERWKVPRPPPDFRKMVAGKAALELSRKRTRLVEIGAVTPMSRVYRRKSGCTAARRLIDSELGAS